MEAIQYLILDRPIPVKSLQLGSLVSNYMHPVESFFLGTLAGERKISVREKYDINQFMAQKTNEAIILEKLLSLSDSQLDVRKTSLSFDHCVNHTLTNVGAWFRILCGQEKARAWLQDSLNSRKAVYLLTGILTMRHRIVTRKRPFSNNPVTISDTIAGGDRLTFGAESDSEVIFAVASKKVKLRKLGLRKDVVLKPEENWLGISMKNISYRILTSSARAKPIKEGSATTQVEQPTVSLHKLPIQDTSAAQEQLSNSNVISGIDSMRRESEVDQKRYYLAMSHEQVLEDRNAEDWNIKNLLVLEEIGSKQPELDKSSNLIGNDGLEEFEDDKAVEYDDYAESKSVVKLLLADPSMTQLFALGGTSKISFEKLFDHLNTKFFTYCLQLKNGAQTEQEKLAAQFLKFHRDQTVFILTEIIFSNDERSWTGLDIEGESESLHLNDQLDWLNDYEKPIALEVPSSQVSHGFDERSTRQREDFKTLDRTIVESFCMKGKPLEDFKRAIKVYVAAETAVSQLRGTTGLLPKRLLGLRSLATLYLTFLSFTAVSSVMAYFWLPLRDLDDVLFSSVSVCLFGTLAILCAAPEIRIPVIAMSSPFKGAGIVGLLVFPRILYEELDLPSLQTVFVGHVSRYTAGSKTPISSIGRWEPGTIHLIARRRMYLRLLSSLGSSLDVVIQLWADHLQRFLRPAIRQGLKRFEWICVSITPFLNPAPLTIQECGTPLYGDFEMADEDITDSSQHPIVEPSSSAVETASEDIVAQHEASPRSSRTAGQQADSRNDNTLHPLLRRRARSNPSRERSPDTPINTNKWFELCINYGVGLTRLGEIPLNDIENDTQLFRAIKTRYESVRASRIKDLYLIKPVDIQYVQVICTAI